MAMSIRSISQLPSFVLQVLIDRPVVQADASGSGFSGAVSSENVVHDLAVYIGETEITTAVVVGKILVVQA